ncbi:MAG: SGNH/GDSL hydrolase family protein [Verrucomicrobiae bacterium]|nr:SGNH/GDSL hydrolase family protein [Verrucomicrobiae bacterium]
MKRTALFLITFSTGFASAQDQAEPADFPGKARLLLPPVIHALEGLETNLYFDNSFLLLNPDSFAVDVNCPKGAQQNERWTWTPEAGATGEFPLSLELLDDDNRSVARASGVVRVHQREVVSPPEMPRTLLIIGDSLTAASAYPARIVELAKEDGWPLELIGTRGPGVEEGNPPGEVCHEGYGGWTAERFATHFTGKARGGPYRECGSPFLYKDNAEDPNESPRLDFARYCTEFNGGKGPDFVTILLGCNDTFRATDETIEERIDVFEKHTETLLSMIHALRPETRIGLVLPMPPAGTQDAFGANYGSGQTRWQYRRNRHRLVERMTLAFSDREKDGIHLVPAHLNLDPVHGFPAASVPAHARTETSVERLNNGVHPSSEGYRQIGDALYAWLRSFDQEKRTQ